MKKTLSLVLAMLMLLSVFTVTSLAAVAAPVVSGITCTYDGISITWDAVEGAVTYVVFRDDTAIAVTNDCEYVDVNVDEGKSYVYNIGAQGEDGKIIQSAVGFDMVYIRPYCAHKNCTEIIDYPATVFNTGLKHNYCNTCGTHLPGKVIPMLVPETPVINYLSNGVNGVKVAWNKVDGAKSYYLYRRTAGQTKWEGPIILTGTSYEDKTAQSGVYYKYAVRAFSEAGLSPYNGGKVIKRVATPMNLAVSNSASGIYFKWDKVVNATSYRVYRKLATDKNWTYLTTVKTTYYTDTKAEAGSDYIYTVRAVSNNVYSNFLSSAKIRRLEVPALNSAKSTAEGIYVDFKPVEGATGYRIYRKVGSGAWTTQSYLGTIRTTKSHTYLDVSARKGVTYTYTVRAYFADGTSTSYSSYVAKGISCKDAY